MTRILDDYLHEHLVGQLVQDPHGNAISNVLRTRWDSTSQWSGDVSCPWQGRFKQNYQR